MPSLQQAEVRVVEASQETSKVRFGDTQVITLESLDQLCLFDKD